MCVPSRHWRLTGKGAEIAASGRPVLDDLDRDILRAIAQRDHVSATSVARRVAEAHEMTIRRRLRSLADRKLVVNGSGWSLTEEGHALVGPTRPWVDRLSAKHERHHDYLTYGKLAVVRFG